MRYDLPLPPLIGREGAVDAVMTTKLAAFVRSLGELAFQSEGSRLGPLRTLGEFHAYSLALS
jgi:hypothetical protein